ncbi:hypothetical protein TorRG33x02_237150 [Trema orientale]|uniref:Uncharacterized protein n=1 Tax=Trema orientale TaxID=63057 RepID=A0A2P5E014_TREOI|nr:hypothetical protein TorRG33x02_237150 [Trema orientale]
MPTRELGLFESNATFGVLQPDDGRQPPFFLTFGGCELHSSSWMIYDWFYGEKQLR